MERTVQQSPQMPFRHKHKHPLQSPLSPSQCYTQLLNIPFGMCRSVVEHTIRVGCQKFDFSIFYLRSKR